MAGLVVQRAKDLLRFPVPGPPPATRKQLRVPESGWGQKLQRAETVEGERL